jgi:DNA-binding transcriptional LysR family regulator
MKLDDMRLFGQVARDKSFTTAARRLGLPKQTLSRRIAELERGLGVQLLHRTTRRLHLTDAGAAYADRCIEIVRLAEEAEHAVTKSQQVPSGVLRVTADPLFGEAFLTGLVIEHAARWPDVEVEVLLTRRHVNLVEEGFDVAFRVGVVDDPGLTGKNLGPARVRFCASPAYIARRGVPQTPDDLLQHECVMLLSDATVVRWPFRGKKGATLVPVTGRLRFNSFAMTRSAALAGLGIAIFPEFACAGEIEQGLLVPVLDDWLTDVGSVWLVHPANRYLAARVRSFVELATSRLGRQPPWLQNDPLAVTPATATRQRVQRAP